MAETKSGELFQELVIRSLGKAIVEGVGETAKSKAKTLSAHFFGLSNDDEAGLMDAEERAIDELGKVNTKDAVEARVAEYRNWLVNRTPPKGQEDTIPGLEPDIAREIAWRARKWAIYVTTNDDPDTQMRIVLGLMEADGFHAKDMRLLAAVRETPFTAKVTEWCKKRLDSFQEHLSPEVRARVARNIETAVSTVWQRLVKFVDEVVKPALKQAATKSKTHRKKFRDSRASHSLLGGLLRGRGK